MKKQTLVSSREPNQITLVINLTNPQSVENTAVDPEKPIMETEQIIPKSCQRILQSGQISFQPELIIPQQDHVNPRPDQTSPDPDVNTSQYDHSMQTDYCPAQPEDTSVQPEDTSAQPEDTSAQPEDTSAQPEDTSAQPNQTTLQQDQTSIQPDPTIIKPDSTSLQPALEQKLSPVTLANIACNVPATVKEEPLDLFPDEGLFTLPTNFIKQEPIEVPVKGEIIECSISAVSLVKSEEVTNELFSAGDVKPSASQVVIKYDLDLPAETALSSLLAKEGSKHCSFLGPKAVGGLATNASFLSQDGICNERMLAEAILQMIPSENSTSGKFSPVTNASESYTEKDGFSTPPPSYDADDSQMDGDFEELYRVQREVISLEDEADWEILPIIKPVQNYLKNNVASLTYLKQNLSPVKNILKALKSEKIDSYETSNLFTSGPNSTSDGSSNMISQYPSGHPLVDIVINLQKLPGISKSLNIVQNGSTCSIRIMNRGSIGSPGKLVEHSSHCTLLEATYGDTILPLDHLSTETFGLESRNEPIFEKDVSEVLKPFDSSTSTDYSKSHFDIRTSSVIRYTSSGLSATLINPGTYVKLVNDGPSLFRTAQVARSYQRSPSCSPESKNKRSRMVSSDQCETDDGASPQRPVKVSKTTERVGRTSYNLRRSSRNRGTKASAANSGDGNSSFSNSELDETLPDTDINNKDQSSENSSLSNAEEALHENSSKATRTSRRICSRDRTKTGTKSESKSRPSTRTCERSTLREIQHSSGNSKKRLNPHDNTDDSRSAMKKRKLAGKQSPCRESVVEDNSTTSIHNDASPARNKRKQGKRHLCKIFIDSDQNSTLRTYSRIPCLGTFTNDQTCPLARPTDKSDDPSTSAGNSTFSSDENVCSIVQGSVEDSEDDLIKKEKADIAREKRLLMEKVKEYEKQQRMIEEMKKDLLKKMESIGDSTLSTRDTDNHRGARSPSSPPIVVPSSHIVSLNKSPCKLTSPRKPPSSVKVLVGDGQGRNSNTKSCANLGISEKASNCIREIIDSNEPIVTGIIDQVISKMNAGSYSLDDGLEGAVNLLPQLEYDDDFVPSDREEVPGVAGGEEMAAPSSPMDYEVIVPDENASNASRPQKSNARQRSSKPVAGCSKSSLRYFRNHSDSSSNDCSDKNSATEAGTAMQATTSRIASQPTSQGLLPQPVDSRVLLHPRERPSFHYATNPPTVPLNTISRPIISARNQRINPRPSSQLPASSSVAPTISEASSDLSDQRHLTEKDLDSAGVLSTEIRETNSQSQERGNLFAGKASLRGFHKPDQNNGNTPADITLRGMRGLTGNDAKSISAMQGIKKAANNTNRVAMRGLLTNSTIHKTSLSAVRGPNVKPNNINIVSTKDRDHNNGTSNFHREVNGVAGLEVANGGPVPEIIPSVNSRHEMDKNKNGPFVQGKSRSPSSTSLSTPAQTVQARNGSASSTPLSTLPDDDDEDEDDDDADLRSRVVLGKVPLKDDATYLAAKLTLHSDTLRHPSMMNNKGHTKVPCLEVACEDVTMFCCPECYYQTNCRYRYRTHYYVHSYTTYKCRHCDYFTTNREKTVQHEIRHGIDEDLTCDLCNYVCFESKSLVRHRKIHLAPSERDLKCRKCSFEGMNFPDIRRHLLLEHGLAGHKIKLECLMCPNQRFSTFRSLGDHVIEHMSPNGEYKCNICEFTDLDQMVMQDHIRLHSKAPSFMCDLCSFQANTRKGLVDHLDVHRPPQMLKCTMCDFVASERNKLEEHFLEHSNETYSCNTCDFVSFSLSEILNHRKRHHVNTGAQEREVICPACKLFRTRRNCDLKKHLLMQHDLHGDKLMTVLNKLYSSEFRRPTNADAFKKALKFTQDNQIR